MARKLRMETEQGLYHVLNRGNYRHDIFATSGAKVAFEKALLETLAGYGWRLHAYVLMSNHYHLAVETPQPNLVDGMHALQSTFATRFNRLRKERGHVFQGRYQSLIVEDSAALAGLVDYIHLNPFRAGLETIETLGTYPWGSLRRFVEGARLAGQTGDLVMAWRDSADSPKAWRTELRRLQELAVDEEEQKRLGFARMSRGWAIGTSGWRKALAKEYAHLTLTGLSRQEAADIRTARWEGVWRKALTKWGIHTEDNVTGWLAEVGVKRRLQVAIELRAMGAPYGWIAPRLALGQPESLRIRLDRLQKCYDVPA